MARVYLVMPDTDKDRYVRQARREGMSLSAWLRAGARDRLTKHGQLAKRQKVKRFRTAEDVRAFFERVHALADLENEPEREPDWEEHLAVMNESKMKGLPKP